MVKRFELRQVRFHLLVRGNIRRNAVTFTANTAQKRGIAVLTIFSHSAYFYVMQAILQYIAVLDKYYSVGSAHNTIILAANAAKIRRIAFLTSF
jgi:hypothetical protein